ncbi:hypothetical protein KI387_024497, partial [Taxus chinensis]
TTTERNRSDRISQGADQSGSSFGMFAGGADGNGRHHYQNPVASYPIPSFIARLLVSQPRPLLHSDLIFTSQCSKSKCPSYCRGTMGFALW